jgi:hypothetical protein
MRGSGGARLFGRGMVAVVAVVAALGGLPAADRWVAAPEPAGAVTSPFECERSYPYASGSQAATILALGDSYSSGEGLRGSTGHCYEDGTDVGTNECHRSAFAYSAEVQPSLGHDFRACSGALIKHLTSHNYKNNEHAQLDPLSSQHIATLMTIGGNDAGFDSVVMACAALYVRTGAATGTIRNIAGPISDAEGHVDNCPGWLDEAEARIPSIKKRLVAAYQTILRRSGRNAKLLVGTYPKIFPPVGAYNGQIDHNFHRFCVGTGLNASAAGQFIEWAVDRTVQGNPAAFENLGEAAMIALGFEQEDVREMVRIQDLMNAAIEDAVNEVKATGDTRIRLVDVAGTYGDHTVSCGDDGRPEPYMNGIRLALGSWDEKFISKASFHPNEAGQLAMGQLFDSRLAGGVPLSALRPKYSYLQTEDNTLTRRSGQGWFVEFPTVGGTGTPTWDAPSGLPPGLSFDTSSGRLTGYSTAIGNYPVTFVVRTPNGQSSSRAVTLRVTDIAPCTVVWDTASGGSWFTATNWAPPRVPGAADVACISGDGGLYPTIEAGQTATVGNVLTEHYGGIHLQGTIELVGTGRDSVIESLGSSGRVYVGSGARLILGNDIASSPSVLSADFDGPGTTVIPAGATVDANGLRLTGNFENQGTINVIGCSNGLVFAASFVNRGTIQGSGCLTASDPAITLTNGATGVIRSTGSYLHLGLDVLNQGTIAPSPGTVLSTDHRVVGGRASGGGTLSITGNGVAKDLNATNLSRLEVSGRLESSGNFVLGRRAVINGGHLTGSGGYTVLKGSELTASPMYLESTLTNRGTIMPTCNGMFLTGELRNEGLITTSPGSSACVYDNGGGTMLNLAGGSIRPASGGYMYLGAPVTNSSTVSVPPDARLTLAKDSSGGSWTGEGTLELTATLIDPEISQLANAELNSNGAISSSGTLHLAKRTASSSGRLVGTGSFVVPVGSLLEAGSLTMHAPVLNQGVVEVRQCGGLRLAAELRNEGVVSTPPNSTGCVYENDATQHKVVNLGTGTIRPGVGGTLAFSVPVQNLGFADIPAASTITLSTPSEGGVWAGGGELQLSAHLSNAEVSGLSTMTLQSSGGLTNAVATVLPQRTRSFSGTLAGRGSFVVPPGARLEAGSLNVFAPLNNQGVLSVDNCGGVSLGSDLTNDGLITTIPNGSGCVVPNGPSSARLHNRSTGIVSPGSTAYLTISVPTTNEGQVRPEQGETVTLNAPASGGTWAGAGELSVQSILSEADVAGMALTTLHSAGGLSASGISTLGTTTRSFNGTFGGAGSFVVSPNRTLEVGSLQTRAPLVNKGTLVVTNCGGLQMGADVQNEALLTTPPSSSACISPLGPTAAKLRNAGTGTVRPGPMSTLTAAISMVNSGLVQVPNGTRVAVTASSSGGTWSGGGEVDVSAILSNVDVSGLQTLAIQGSGGLSTAGTTLLGKITRGQSGTLGGRGEYVVPPGSRLEASSLTIAAPVTNRGVLSVQTCGGAYLSADLVNEGTLTSPDLATSCINPDGPTESKIVNKTAGVIRPGEGGHLSVGVPIDSAGTVDVPLDAVVTVGAASQGGRWTGDGEVRVTGVLANPDLSELRALSLEGGGGLASSGTMNLPIFTRAQSGRFEGPGSYTVPLGGDLVVHALSAAAPVLNLGTISLRSCGGLQLSTKLVNHGVLSVPNNITGCIHAASGAPAQLVNENGGSIAPEPGSYLSVAVPLLAGTGGGTATIPAGTTVSLSAPSSGTAWRGDGLLQLGAILQDASVSELEHLLIQGGGLSASVKTTLARETTVSSGRLEGRGSFNVPSGGQLRLQSLSALAPVVNRGQTEVTGCGGLRLSANFTNVGLLSGTGCVHPESGVATSIINTPSGTVDTSQGLQVNVPILSGAATVVLGDFTGSGRSSVASYNPSVQVWAIQGGAMTGWGAPGDVPVSADYNGDGIADVAVFRPSDQTWYVQPSSSFPNGIATQWGIPGDIPVPADYNGDGLAEIAVFRPSDQTWYSQTAGSIATQWGIPGDVPVPADYDGDGDDDVAVYRPSDQTWYSQGAGGLATQWGIDGDVPVPVDFNGDGKADVAVYRPADQTWYSQGAGGIAVQWGAPGDLAIPGDYDADGDADVAVFRPSDATWYVRNGLATQWGAVGDVPVIIPPAVRQLYG